MMGGGGNKAAVEQAARQRQEDEARKQRISSGGIDINRTFATLLDPDRTFTDPPPIVATPKGAGSMGERMANRSAANRNRALMAGRENPTMDYLNSPMLAGLESDFMEFASPEVGRQGRKAAQKVAFQLARRGTLESSVGAEQGADVERQKGEAMARISSMGQDIRMNRAKDIERARQSIMSQLEASGNSQAAAQSAINQASTLGTTEAFSPLGQLFNVGLATGADVMNTRAQPFSSPTIFSRGSRGSSKVLT